MIKDPDKANYCDGDEVLLTATAEQGYTFSHWSGDISGDANPISIQSNGNMSITANFEACPTCIYVPQDYGSIQEALTNSQEGATIIVRDGIYDGPNNRNLDFGGKSITLRSENGPENCIIDCEGAGRGFIFEGSFEAPIGADTIVDGFTIKNGDVPDSGG